MKISIAMATYNGAKYLPEQLQSFIDQTRQPDELVITDDCSTDETLQIIEDFAKEAPFDVKFSRNAENLGYAGNFNVALMQSTGDLVFLSDQDDVWFPEKIELITQLAVNNPDKLAIMNDALLTDEHLNHNGITKLNQIYAAGLSEKDFVMGCCAAIRRELLDLCLPIPKYVAGHDNWIMMFANHLNVKLVVPTTLQYYRRHSSNESKYIANDLNKINFFKRIINGIAKDLERLHKFSDDELVLERINAQINGIEKAIQFDVSDNFKTSLEVLLNKKKLLLKNKKERIDLRSKSFLTRVYDMILLSKSGGYSGNIKGVFKDILGNRI